MPDSGLTDEERTRLRELEAQMAAIRERTHGQANAAQSNVAMASILARMDARITDLAAPKASDVPLWLKVSGAGLAAIVALAVIIGGITAYGRAGAETVARITALESWKIESATLPTRVQALETGIDMAKRVRDQQQQGMSDRLIGLERSDKDDRDALSRVLQSLASMTAQLQAQGARVEELLRRQDRLESRMAPRTQSETHEQPTALPSMRRITG